MNNILRTSGLGGCLAAWIWLASVSGVPAQGTGGGGWETGGVVPAQQFMGKTPEVGAGYKVNAEAFNDGMMNKYYLVTEFGEFEVEGTELLLERINEVVAITEMRKISAGQSFGGAVGKAGSDKLVAAGKLIMNPFKTIGNIPKGASRFVGGIGEAMKLRTSEYEDSAYASLAGASKAKRELAARYHVNPYSSNSTLQDELNKVAWVQAGVGLGVDAGLSVATAGAAGIALTAVNVNQSLYQTMIDEDPSNLRIMNRKKLMEDVGLTREQADTLLMHPWFSPWHNTVICESLKSLGAERNQAAFIDLAARSEDELDALYFQRTAQMIAKYHRTTAPAQRIEPQGMVATFFDKAGCLVVPLHLDYLRWTQRVAERVEAIQKAAAQRGGSILVWTTGDASPRVLQELTARGIKLTTRVKTED